MKHACLAIVALTAFTALAALATPARAEITVIDNNRTLDVDCTRDPEITLVGNHITITTEGVCVKIAVMGNHATVRGSASLVYVAGNHNTLLLAAADEVSVAGNHNNVSVRKAITLRAPRIANLGNKNRVTQPN